MIKSINELIKYKRSMYPLILIETQGSFNNHNHLMMQNINECRAFFKQIKSKDVKLSVNIGHLNLAANRFKFNKIDYLNQLKNYIEAFEISNNNGYYDQHKPISPNSWYWSVLRNKDFRNKIMILEYRNVSINKIKQSIKLFHSKMKV